MCSYDDNNLDEDGTLVDCCIVGFLTREKLHQEVVIHNSKNTTNTTG